MFREPEDCSLKGGERIGNHAHHTIANVPVGVAVVGRGVELLRKGAASVGVGRKIQIMRPGIAHLTGQLVKRPLPQNNGQRIVVRTGVILDLRMSPKSWLGRRSFSCPGAPGRIG